MARWCVLLLPPSGMRRAQPRWLCGEGSFSLHNQRAWVVVDPGAARQRISAWLSAKGCHHELLQRMRLVPCCGMGQTKDSCFDHARLMLD